MENTCGIKQEPGSLAHTCQRLSGLPTPISGNVCPAVKLQSGSTLSKPVPVNVFPSCYCIHCIPWSELVGTAVSSVTLFLVRVLRQGSQVVFELTV